MNNPKKYTKFNFRNKPPFLKPGEIIDYKNIDILRRFITEQGKILPRRTTNLTARSQREMTKAIKQARILGSLSFSKQE
jgi:small subunit ribosomal protein S18